MAGHKHAGPRPVGPGDTVRVEGAAGAPSRYGMVIQCWAGGAPGGECYAAAFEDALPATGAAPTPQVQRWPRASLRRIADDLPIWERRAPASLAEKLKSSRAFWIIVALAKVGITVALVAALVQHWSCR